MVIAVDDSEIEIENRPHTVLTALLFEDPAAVEQELRDLKLGFGFQADFELKWNSEISDRRKREEITKELLPILAKTTSLITIAEGKDRQVAAEKLMIQIDDALVDRAREIPETSNQPSPTEVLFDIGIVTRNNEFQAYLRESGRDRLKNLNYQNVDSRRSPLIQCADLFVGFQRLAIDLALGRKNPTISVYDDGFGAEIDIDLLNYVLLSLRYTSWGIVPPHQTQPSDPPADGTWPVKNSKGLGLRIHSSISEESQSAIYGGVGVVYVGCLH